MFDQLSTSVRCAIAGTSYVTQLTDFKVTIERWYVTCLRARNRLIKECSGLVELNWESGILVESNFIEA